MGQHTYVTKVLPTAYNLGVALNLCLMILRCTTACYAQAVPQHPHQPGPAESLYLRLSSVGLDSGRVFRVRESSLDRPAIHITLEDGTIAFTEDVSGKITGAFFEGDGELLLVPPNEVERKSMSLFTGMAILEERFSTAYFRFNDNTAAELQPGLRAPEDPQEFVARWNETARNLAHSDAMRLLASFSDVLPSKQTTASTISASSSSRNEDDRMLHVRLQGNTLGIFDILFDSTAAEQVEAGQAKATEDGTVYYNVWTSFTAGDTGKGHPALGQTLQTLPASTQVHADPISVSSYVVDVQVKPPKEIDADVKLNLDVSRDGSRFLVFELSRFLRIESVEEDGRGVEFIHNPAVEGTRMARSGNDLVAVILDEPARKGQQISLRFLYSGEVLAEAGKGLLYVGERGTWYPNRGLAMSRYDLTFHYPAGWTLVATGKPIPIATGGAPGEGGAQSSVDLQASRWVSERPIPVAGFDLGKYVKVSAQAGEISVDTYATASVERDFPRPPVVADTTGPERPKVTPQLPPSPPPSPARNATVVAEAAARAIRTYSDWFGPYPYSKLALTQLPGRESQGWPGLVFLSSYAFLTREDRQSLHMDAMHQLIAQQVPSHEVGHQWWGDLITWKTYRDQWFSEGLANYCSLMILQENNPEGFQQILEGYRRDLVKKNKDGNLPKDAGPVTLGGRLLSSRFPEAYEAVNYGRGTWLFHMLRSMLIDAARNDPRHPNGEDPFLRALRKVRERYEGRAISTSELLDVFAEDLPPSLRYEGKASLDWFLDSWVNRTSLSELELQNLKFVPTAKGVTVSGLIRQKDAENNFVTSVPLYGVLPGKAPVYLGRIFADGAESSFHLSAPAGTHKILVDPEKTVLTNPK